METILIFRGSRKECFGRGNIFGGEGGIPARVTLYAPDGFGEWRETFLERQCTFTGNGYLCRRTVCGRWRKITQEFDEIYREWHPDKWESSYLPY